MVSVRRTLSPIPRPDSRINGEAGSVASPLSKSSSASQVHIPVGDGFQYSSYNTLELALYKMYAFICGCFYHRSSRSIERPKWKGPIPYRRKDLLRFSLCFMVGAFLGLTPLGSMNFSMSTVSKRRSLFFENVPSTGKYQLSYARMQNSSPDLLTAQETLTSLVASEYGRNYGSSEPNESKPELPGGFQDKVAISELPTGGKGLGIRKLLIVVTTTYTRQFQAYYLYRLAQTLKLVPPPLIWIVVEMAAQSEETAKILRMSGIMYRHLVCNKNVTEMMDRNVHQRNVAVEHIEMHHLDGIVYFADDDKIFSLDVFKQLRQVRRFGIWKVAKLSINQRNAILDGPVCIDTKVIGWKTNNVNRRFYVEISGFAFNSTILWDPKRGHRSILEPVRQLDTIKEEFQASAFIEQILEDESQMEGLPGNCSSIMVWHLPLESYLSRYPHQWSMSANLDLNTPLA